MGIEVWLVHVFSRHSKTILAVGEWIGVQRYACRALMMQAAGEN